MGRRLKTTVWVHAEDGGIDMVSFGPDDEKIPGWAKKQMGDHVWDDQDEDADEAPTPAAPPAPGEDAGDVYDQLLKADLNAEIDRRNQGRDDDQLIKPEGTKNDALIAALRADDQAQAAAAAAEPA